MIGWLKRTLFPPPSPRWYPPDGECEWIQSWDGGRQSYMAVRATRDGHRYEGKVWDSGEVTSVFDADTGDTHEDWGDRNGALEWFVEEAKKAQRRALARERRGEGWTGIRNPRAR